MNNKRLLFVTPQLPQAIQDSPNNGSWQVLSLLADEYDVALACPLASSEEETAHQLCEHLGISSCIHAAVDLKPSKAEGLRASAMVNGGQDSGGFSMTRFFGNVEPQHLRKKEVHACRQVDLVFAQPEDAAALSDAGVPFGKLQFSLTEQRSEPVPGKRQTFNTTNKHLGYVGYLPDEKNASSLLWFIRNVWPIALQLIRCSMRIAPKPNWSMR